MYEEYALDLEETREHARLHELEPISLMGIAARATPIELLGAIVSRA
jgi:hypothetical protein